MDWTVRATHPLSGRNRSKTEFRDRTFAKLKTVLPRGAQLRVTSVLVSGGVIAERWAYPDPALVQGLFDVNPQHDSSSGPAEPGSRQKPSTMSPPKVKFPVCVIAS